MLLNCGVGEDSWESLGLQGDPTSPFWRRSVMGVHWKDWCWSWNSNTLATWCEELTHRKDPDAGKDWGQEEKGTTEDEMVRSPTQWAWIWVNSRSWWWTGRPGMLWFTRLQSRTRLSDWTGVSASLSPCFSYTLSFSTCLVPASLLSLGTSTLAVIPPGMWRPTFWTWVSPFSQVSGHVSAQLSSLSSLLAGFLCFLTVSTLHDDFQLVVGFSMMWFQIWLDMIVIPTTNWHNSLHVSWLEFSE